MYYITRKKTDCLWKHITLQFNLFIGCVQYILSGLTLFPLALQRRKTFPRCLQTYLFISFGCGDNNDSQDADKLKDRAEKQPIAQHALQKCGVGDFWSGKVQAWRHGGADRLNLMFIFQCYFCRKDKDNEMCS